MNSPVRASSIHASEIHIPTLAVSPALPGESAGQRLNRILDITDETVRERLIDECLDRLKRCVSFERRYWWDQVKALVDGRPKEVQERLEAERMERVRR